MAKETKASLKDAVGELQQVVSHNAKVAAKNYEHLLEGVQMNNLVINAVLRCVGLSVEELEREIATIREEAEIQSQQEEEEVSIEERLESLEEGGDAPGEHPEGAVIFGD